jgi:hypothetical protein
MPETVLRALTLLNFAVGEYAVAMVVNAPRPWSRSW